MTDLGWISDRVGWALAAVPCGKVLCPRIARTSNGGRSWTELPNLPAHLNGPGCTRLPCVHQVRFATTAIGYLYGPSLFITRDGGLAWTHVKGASVESLEPGAQGVVRVVYDHGGCPGPCDRMVEAAPVGSDKWRVLLSSMSVLGSSRADTAQVSRAGSATYIPIYGDLAAGVGTQQTTIFRSLDAGRSWVRLADPCGGTGSHVHDAIDLTATTSGFLAVLCSSRNPQQTTGYSVVTSANAGRTWSARQRVPASTQFYPNLIAAASPKRIIVSNSADGGSGPYTYRLMLSTDDGRHWATVVSDREALSPAAPYASSLMFQNSRVGHWVAYPDAIWTTTDSGRHWTHLRFTLTGAPSRAGRAMLCAPAQLVATFGGQGATETLLGGVTLTNHGPAACRLVGRPTIIMRGGSPHDRLAQHAMNTAALFPGERFATTVVLYPGHSASVRIQWSNWCNPAAHANPGSAPAEGRRPTKILVAPAPSTRPITATVPGGLHSMYLPVCNAPNLPGRIDVSLWPTGYR